MTRHNYKTPYKNGARPSQINRVRPSAKYTTKESEWFCWLMGDPKKNGYTVKARTLQEAGQRFAESEISRTNNTVYIRILGYSKVYAVEPGGGITECYW